VERRLAAILAADVVGYVVVGTILYGRLEDQSSGISKMRLSLILLLLIGLVIVVAPSRAVGLTCGAYYEDDWDHHSSEYKLEFLTRCIESGNSPNLAADYARPRRHELAAALNRLRTLEVRQAS